MRRSPSTTCTCGRPCSVSLATVRSRLVNACVPRSGAGTLTDRVTATEAPERWPMTTLRAPSSISTMAWFCMVPQRVMSSAVPKVRSFPALLSVWVDSTHCSTVPQPSVS